MANKKRTQPSVRNPHRFSLKRSAACVKLAVAGGLAVGSMSPVQAELPVPSAVWASMGQATRQVIGNHMQINQQTDRAILNWQSFNIGKENSVHFQQPSSTSIALNKIFQNDPSRILGALTANGQVYLVNRNGFVFGKDSRVDVRGLVASTLDISDDVFDQGITKVFSNSGSAAFQNNEFVLRDQNGDAVLDEGGQPIKALLAKDANGNPIRASITLEEGAQVQSGTGERILIIAPTITNKGSIQSDDGQAILAASTDKVYLQEASGDSDVRGLLVEVETGGDVSNLGEISSRRGNVTMIGFAVNQNGKVSASTSINVNGSIRLIARERASVFETDGFEMRATSTTRAADIGDGLGTSATVSFGENSLTEVLPELGTGETAIDEQVQPLSKVEAMGHKIHVKKNADIFVPGGRVDMVATQNPINPLQDSVNRNSSRILVDSGATIDVSGIATTVKAMESNIVEVELRLNQLKDSPLQRDGILFGKTILVDIRKGSPIADVQPDIDAIQRTLGERLAKGGEINLSSEGDTLVQQNAVLDFSGGAVTYLDGFITTTKLTSNGRIFDISEAHPSLKYDGIYGEVVKVYEKWGVRKVWKVDGPFSLARREAGYIEGHDAGRLTIKSPNPLLEGELKGGTASGRLQRTVDSKAYGGELLIDMRAASAVVQSVILSSAQNRVGVDVDLDDPFPVNDQGLNVALAIQSGMIGKSGIQDVSILTHGTVEIARNSTVGLADGGSLRLQGGSISVNGHVKGAGADLSLTTALNAQTIGRLDGSINIGKDAKIDLQGEWVNDRATPFALIDSMPVTIGGGNFVARANGDIALQSGSVIDVSGGAWLKTNGTIEAGEAGSVRMIAAAENIGSNITLDGTLNAYGIKNGGTLELEANAVAIRRKREDEIEGLRPLQLQEGFFGQGGFANYIIRSNVNGLVVDDGVNITLRQVNRVLDGAAITTGNADSIAAISRVSTLPLIQRSPSSLVLAANHSINPNPSSHLEIGGNAKIVADPLSSISLISDSSLFFDGTITARGGDVLMSIIPPVNLPDPLYQPTQGLWLGENARIDVSGIAITTVDALGRQGGEVYDGGSVILDAARGFVATNSGSFINVSGTSASLNLPRLNPNGFGLSYDPITVGSHGGSIEISAAEGLFVEGQMAGRRGNATGTLGATLSVGLDATRRDPDEGEGIILNFPTGPGVLQISQQIQPVLLGAFAEAGDALPAQLARKGYLASDQVSDGGFASLNVLADDEIRFKDDIALKIQGSLVMNSPKFGWVSSNPGNAGQVVLNAAQVKIGSTRHRTAIANPTGGNASLTVNADLIELNGGAFTSGFNEVNLNASNDIRLLGERIINTQMDFVGEFITFSNLNLTAKQIYPTTLSQFQLAVIGDPNGSIAIKGRGEGAPVLSAFGKLAFKAPNIEQNGVIKAPLGEIVLDADNSIKLGAQSMTSVSAEGEIIPFGVTEGGLEWLYPVGNRNIIVSAPEKRIALTSDRIQRDEGAVIDLSGGGDLLAYEFIPGIGGSVDVLATGESFAVIPGFNGYAPLDPFISTQANIDLGATVYLEGSDALPAGNYTVLPARYALLPGAYLITPQSGTRDMMPGTRTINLEGAPVVSGFLSIAGTNAQSQRREGFAVEPGSIALTRSQLNLTTANKFFAQQAIANETAMPRLPKDAGYVLFDAKNRLDLPTVRAEASNGGLAGLVDIIAENISIVNQSNGSVGGVVQLTTVDLNNLEVGSLLIGGSRSFDKATGTTKIDVKSETVTLSEDTVLEGAEIILTATDTLELKERSILSAVGEANASEQTNILETTGDGALVRVSVGNQVVKNRTGTVGAKGDLIIGQDSTIAASNGSVLLDSTRQLRMSGEVDAGKSLNISAEAINLGEVDNSLNGLSLNNMQLSRLNVDELSLNSRGNVNIFGNVHRTDDEGNSIVDNEGNFTSLEFGHLIIDSAGLAGHQMNGQNALVSAETITLKNKNSINGVVGAGSGELYLIADSMEIGGGAFKLSGFNSVDLTGKQSITGVGDSSLTSVGDLSITSGYLTGATGSKTTIDASGHNLSIAAIQDVQMPNKFGIAAELNLIADELAIEAPLLFRSGVVRAEAKTGDVVLAENGSIDVSGTVVTVGLSDPIHLQAGRIELISHQQNVVTNSGSRLSLNGITSVMDAGALTVSTVQGQAQLNGSINALGGNLASGGNVMLDVASFSDAGFSGINTLLSSSGFTGAIDIRLREGNLSIAQQDHINSKNINLAVDNGKLDIAGKLDADFADGGSINLSSSDALTLASTAELTAVALNPQGHGGKIKFSSIDGGGIVIENGATIDVSANGGKEGEVHLRAERLGANDINIGAIAQGAISGDSNVTVEAVEIYNYSNLNSTAINTIKNDTAAYMSAVAINDSINDKFGTGFEMAPGIEVRSAGNIALSSKWDLADWRYGPNDTPGYLTLRAAGDIVLQQDLSDAFAPGAIPFADSGFEIQVDDMLQSGRSWNYNVTAGSQIAAANSKAVTVGIGDIKIGNNVRVRTGTGDIDFTAGRDIAYGNNRSVVYTAGRPDDENPYGFKPIITGLDFYAEYPIDGGDISFKAGRDIKGAVTNQLVTDWLLRTGDWTRGDNAEKRPTAWGVGLSGTEFKPLTPDYRQNVGALGGGNVSITAARNINDLSVVIPTTGKQIGQPADPSDGFDTNYLTNVVEVNGGGDLSINAGANIAGGMIYVDKGTADIVAGGSLTAGSNQGRSPVLALGDSQLNVTVAKNIALEAILDPMVLPQGKITDKENLFFRYSADSQVTLTSITGDVVLKNNVSSMTSLFNQLNFAQNGALTALRVYPASLSAYALSGDVKLDGSLIMYPSAQGQLELYGAKNITTGNTGNPVNIVMSDTDPALLPSMSIPAQNYLELSRRLTISGQGDPSMIYSTIPNHINDVQPVLISTGTGNIIGKDPLLFVSAKHAEVMSGNDIRNVSFQIQHNFNDAQSVITAGRDIKFDIARNSLTGALTNRVQKIETSGPGQLTVLAGRNVDLGSSDGLFTVGNQVNPALAEDGASIDVIAGLAKTDIDVAAYAAGFLNDGGVFGDNYRQAVTDYMRRLTGDDSLSGDLAAEAFKSLAAVEQAHFNAHFLDALRTTFNDQMKVQGNKFSVAKNGFDNAGDDDERFNYKLEMDSAQLELLAATEALFPGTTVLAGVDGYSIDSVNGIVFDGGNDAGSILSAAFGKPRNKLQTGDISMFFSKIHSTDGGDINLYAPNGGVNAGLAVNSSGAKDASDLGVVAIKKGAVHSLVRDDFQVNTTRVMTLGGGDIVIGSTEGDIDAGRGAKTALAAPPPIVRFDEKGNMIVELPTAVAGSGIRANQAPDGSQGDALLFAFQGIIDASEAGVGGKDVTVGATAIVGSDNIDVGGVSVGVPAASSGSIAAGLGNVGNVAAAVQQAVDSSADAGKDASDKMASAAALGIISVDIVGFGDEDVH